MGFALGGRRTLPFIHLSLADHKGQSILGASWLGVLLMNRVLMVLAFSGWALCGISVLSPRIVGSDTRAEIARLSQAVQKVEAGRDALAAELGHLKEAHQDLQHVEKRIASAT